MSTASVGASSPPPSMSTPPAATGQNTSAPGVNVRDFSMLIALLLIVGTFGLIDPAFLGARNLSQLIIELSATAVLSLGMLLIILPGHIDLSVGSGVGLAGGAAAVLISKLGWSAPVALLVTTLVCVGLYAAMGAIVIRERMPAFIVTLGGLLVFKGVHWLVIENQTVPITSGGEDNLFSVLTTYYIAPNLGLALAALASGALGYFLWTGHQREKTRGGSDGEGAFLTWFVTSQGFLLLVLLMNQYRGLPLSILVLGVTALAVQVLTQNLRLGRYLYAVGGSEEAAVVSGIPVQRVVITAFAFMGLIVAIAGYLQTAFSGASTTTTGQLMELDAVAACVIGGTSLKGGRGSVVGVLFGALIMAALLNGMTLRAVSPEMKFIVRGVVLAVAVWIDIKLSKVSSRR
jgi:D-xylose transport system permease protein